MRTFKTSDASWKTSTRYLVIRINGDNSKSITERNEEFFESINNKIIEMESLGFTEAKLYSIDNGLEFAVLEYKI